MSIAIVVVLACAAGYAFGRWYVVAPAALLAGGATALLASPTGVADSPFIAVAALVILGSAVGVAARRAWRPFRR